MKNLPSFNDFQKYDFILEPADRQLVEAFESLETSQGEHTVNEGLFNNWIKNHLSKFFLGSLSSVNMIDKARKIKIDLEIHAIEKEHEFSEDIDSLESQIRDLSPMMDKEKIAAIAKDKEAKIKEHEAYAKTIKVKMKKVDDFIEEAIGNNDRRREYYEAGRADDEIALAELQYKLAKDSADSSEITKYLKKIKDKKKEAEDKAEDLKSMMDRAEKETEGKKEDKGLIDPEKEKKKISTRKAKSVIERKRELEKEIADARADIEHKLSELAKKTKSSKQISSNYLDKVKIQLIEMGSNLDSKINLLNLYKNLGKTEEEIQKKITKEQDMTKIANLINQSIIDGKDANTGTAKLISGIFDTPSGKIDSSKIESVKSRI